MDRNFDRVIPVIYQLLTVDNKKSYPYDEDTKLNPTQFVRRQGFATGPSDRDNVTDSWVVISK